MLLMKFAMQVKRTTYIFNHHAYLVAKSYHSFAFYHGVYHTAFGLCSLATTERLVQSSCVGNAFFYSELVKIGVYFVAVLTANPCVVRVSLSMFGDARDSSDSCSSVGSRCCHLCRVTVGSKVTRIVQLFDNRPSVDSVFLWCPLATRQWILCGGVGSALHVRVGSLSRQLLLCCLVERLLWYRDDALIMYTYAATTGGTPPHYAPPPTYLAAQLPPPPPLPGGTLSPQSKRRRYIAFK